MKKIIAVLIFAVFAFAGYSQQDNSRKTENKKQKKKEKINQIMRLEEEGVPSFRKQNAFGIKLNTDGWGISYEFGHSNSVTRATIYQIEFNEKKHRKEDKQNVPLDGGNGFIFFGNPFVYGKKNIFYQLKGAIGQQILIGGKGNKNGVSVYGIGAGGLSLGLLRPYYMEVQDGNSSKYVKYDSPDSLLFLGQSIVGGAGISKGWNEIKIAPGLHAKTAIRFDYNRFNTVLSGIEGGLNVEYYFKDVQQMVYSPAKKFFLNVYVSFLFGKRK
ncbi:MAG: hypothetical protein IT249_16345 [Chitinophagaceae bacterium]|nr:hypothetical protein [Chitinophagaceae bacterium]